MICLFIRYLGPYVRACVFQHQTHDFLQQLLEPMQSNQDKMESLYTTVPAELACLSVLKLEWEACLAHLRGAMQSCRRKWSAMSMGSSDARSKMLALLQPMSEVHQVHLMLIFRRLEAYEIKLHTSYGSCNLAFNIAYILCFLACFCANDVENCPLELELFLDCGMCPDVPKGQWSSAYL